MTVDTGSCDNWANALPVGAVIAIPFSSKTVASDVWEEMKSAHTTTGTFGAEIPGKIKLIVADGELPIY